MAKANTGKLTDPFLRGKIAHPPKAQTDFPDGTVDGLVVRVGPRGKATWSFRFRVPGAGGVTERGTALNGAKYHRVSLGHYPAVSIKEARQKAAAYLADVEAGKNPLVEFEEKAVDRLDTVSALIDDFMGWAEKNMRTWQTGKWSLHKHIVPVWGSRPVGSITEAEAKTLVANIGKGEPDPETGIVKPAPGSAYGARQWGNNLFRWALIEGRVKVNPFASVKLPKLAKRSRHLDIDEARALWDAACEFREPWGSAIRLLLLTGCREMEICGARRAWLKENETEIVIPGEFYKSDREFLVCLSPPAADIIATLPRHNAGDYLFSTTAGEKPIAGIPSKVMKEIHGKAEAKLGRSMERFALHDLRRTLRTHLPRLKVDEIVAEVVLGHALKGLQATYNLYGYRDEKRHALELWANDLLRTDKPKAGEVAPELDAEAIAAAITADRLPPELLAALAAAIKDNAAA